MLCIAFNTVECTFTVVMRYTYAELGRRIVIWTNVDHSLVWKHGLKRSVDG